jgi:hypothetical protein
VFLNYGENENELCDANTGYLRSFLGYTGMDTKLHSPLITDDSSKTTATALKLVEYLLKQGQTVWMDNFYNSPFLAKTLKIIHKTVLVH